MTSDFHHLAGAYALDALDSDERAAFEAHYPLCDICRADVIGYRETAQLLASAAAVEPPTALKGRVMADIATTRQLPPIVAPRVDALAERREARSRAPRRAAALAAVAAALIAIVGIASLTLRSDPGDPLEAVLAAPDAIVASLSGDEVALQVVWSADRDQVALLGRDLPALAADQAYALWFLLDEGVAPAGLFRPDDSGAVRAVLDVDDLEGNGFGVTIEPSTGSDQPTTPVLYST
ncbi:MAG: anti-sigma factor [Acidimicrobiales bacterium]